MKNRYPEVTADLGILRQVLSENTDLMVVSFTFEHEAVGKLHNHPHVQSTYVESGRFEFTLDGERIQVGQGDSFVIPSHAEHGCRCIEPGRLIDTFTPRRDDFL